ncbi:MAG TPA: DUF523 domain-containing protein [Candidatus Hypogeohydataceae bacterium YC41]
MILISGCLVGLECRYDGTSERNDPLLEALKDRSLVPVCPEQFGGLPTPRARAEIVGGDGHDVLAQRARVMDETGRDVTLPFIKGAKEALKLSQLLGIKEAYLKRKSPSCGLGAIWRKGQLVQGDGVCTALLSKNGIKVTCV